MLPKLMAESKPVIFNGDNYKESWHKEAEARGLPNRRTAVDSLPDLVSKKSIALFGKVWRVLGAGAALAVRDPARELHEDDQHRGPSSRRRLRADRSFPPHSATRPRWLTPSPRSKAAGGKVPASQVALLDELTATIDELQTKTCALVKASDEHAAGDTHAHAKHMRDAVVPAMSAVRAAGDKLEQRASPQYDSWPPPTYQVLLFDKAAAR